MDSAHALQAGLPWFNALPAWYLQYYQSGWLPSSELESAPKCCGYGIKTKEKKEKLPKKTPNPKTKCWFWKDSIVEKAFVLHSADRGLIPGI